MRRWQKIVMALVMAVLFLFGTWKLSRSRTYQLFGEIVARVETEEKVVALTFDDGPAPEFTERILAVLREHGVTGTFFLIGDALELYPELGRRMVEEGHELGNHTYSHQRMVLVSPSFVERELIRTDSLIRGVGYGGAITFRPPFCHKLIALPYYLGRTNRTSITWDVEPDSYPEIAGDSASIVHYVLERAGPGSIILLHVMYPGRAPSLRSVAGIIEGLQRRGYRFVTIGELLAMRRT